LRTATFLSRLALRSLAGEARAWGPLLWSLGARLRLQLDQAALAIELADLLNFFDLLAALAGTERDPFQGQVALAGDLVDPSGDELRGRLGGVRTMLRRVLLLFAPGPRGTCLLVLGIIPVPILDASDEIHSLLPIMHPAIGIERIINARALVDDCDVDPRYQAQVHIPGPIIVAEIIMAVLRTNPQVHEQMARGDDAPGPIDPTGLPVDRRAEPDRRKNLPPIG
jgi:hypothetical protein